MADCSSQDGVLLYDSGWVLRCSKQRSRCVGGYKCYMGKDKYENEDLIAYGWPEDVW